MTGVGGRVERRFGRFGFRLGGSRTVGTSWNLPTARMAVDDTGIHLRVPWVARSGLRTELQAYLDGAWLHLPYSLVRGVHCPLLGSLVIDLPLGDRLSFNSVWGERALARAIEGRRVPVAYSVLPPVFEIDMMRESIAEAKAKKQRGTR